MPESPPDNSASRRLRVGDDAPQFEVLDRITGQPVTLDQYRGSRLLISFHRYAACPFCNLHIHELTKSYDAIAARSIQVLAIFQSSVERIEDQFSDRAVPFVIAADPSLEAYRGYRIEQSLKGMLVSFVHPRGLEATLKGFFPGKIDGDVRSLPADFLVTPQQKIAHAYYASNITQHLPVNEIVSFQWD